MTRSAPWAAAFDDVGWELPEILTVEATARAVEHLESYMRHDEHKGPEYSGSFFHRLGGGDSVETENVITPTDLVALGTLNVSVDAQTAIGFLTDTQEWPRDGIPGSTRSRDHTSYLSPQNPDLVRALLTRLSTNLRLEEIPGPDLGSIAKVWNTLYEVVRLKGLGPTAIHKLFARKRPHLIPIYDSFIGAQLNTTSLGFMEKLHAVLRAENDAFASHLRTIRGDHDLSLIRVFDIVVWREQEQRGRRT